MKKLNEKEKKCLRMLKKIKREFDIHCDGAVSSYLLMQNWETNLLVIAIERFLDKIEKEQ